MSRHPAPRFGPKGGVMIFSGTVQNRQKPAALALSVAGHAVAIALVFLLTLPFGKVRPIVRESRCCSVALYWSGNRSASAARPKPVARRKRPQPVHLPTPVPAPVQASPTPPVPSAPTAQSQPGIAAAQQQPTLGTGTGADDAEPAFPVYYPTPGVSDRSLLPAAEQKIVVDVSVSAHGDVTDEKLVSGLGNNLDQVVLVTVKSWRFHPATLNGTAIASVEELVFPFSRNSPATAG